MQGANEKRNSATRRTSMLLYRASIACSNFQSRLAEISKKEKQEAYKKMKEEFEREKALEYAQQEPSSTEESEGMSCCVTLLSFPYSDRINRVFLCCLPEAVQD
jgi:hypothetical protein